MKFMLYGSFLFNVEFDKSPASLPKKVKKCNMNLKLNYRNTFLSDFRIHIRIFCIDKSISLNHHFKHILSTKNQEVHTKIRGKNRHNANFVIVFSERNE